MQTPPTTTPRLSAYHAYYEEVGAGTGAYAVFAIGQDHRTFVHEGPQPYPYFTKEGAVKMVRRVREAGSIDPAHWECLNRTWEEIELDWHYQAMNEAIDEGRGGSFAL